MLPQYGNSQRSEEMRSMKQKTIHIHRGPLKPKSAQSRIPPYHALRAKHGGNTRVYSDELDLVSNPPFLPFELIYMI